MRCLIVSDIHSNLPALDAVLADAPDYDELWCLGDLVGYGPDPNECIERIQELPHTSMAGNHDWAVLGKLDLGSFNADARTANTWTQGELTPAAREYLNGLPAHVERDGFTLVHASPREPIWEYILDAAAARANFAFFSTPVCLVGHSHIPLVFAQDGQRGGCQMTHPLVLDPFTLGSRRTIINPGSVGQPRDGDPRASYAILDTDTMNWEYHRVAYPVDVVQERMRARGLPRRLVDRLELGR